MSNSKPYSLGKSERLKSRKQIDSLFESGKKITQFPFRLLYSTEPGNGEIKAGFTVSSKNFPGAVERNRVKRLTRESYRRLKKDLEEVVQKNSIGLYLFIIYTGREIAPYTEIYNRLKQILDKLAKILNEGTVANT